VKTPDRFEAAMLELGGDVRGLLDEAEASLERRRRWGRWMTFHHAGRRFFMRRTSWRILVFLQRGDEQAFASRWAE